MIASTLYFIASVASYELERRFFFEYSFSSIIKNDIAMLLYSAYVICNIFKVLSFLWCVYLIVCALRKVILAHTGTVVGRESINDHVVAMEKALHKELRRPLLFAMISAVTYGISDICYDIFAPMLSGIYVKEAAIFGTFSNIQNHYGWLKTINLILLVVCITLFVRALNFISSEIREKYILE